MHKFDFRLVVNETPNKWRPGKKSHAVTEAHVFDRVCMFFLAVVAGVKGLYPR
jgi:hypothetical protein